ncbi:ABC transporter substrate-binding protein [Streptomyces chartreusis]
MKVTWTLTATLALALLGITACSGTSPGGAAGAGRPTEGGTFTMVIGSDPGDLDPAFAALSAAYQVDRFLYDSLVGVDKDGGMVAGLASKWDGSATKVTYTLRKGVTCSDGSPLTAADVAANINFVGDPKNKSTRLGTSVPAGAEATADEAAGTVTVTSPSPDAFLARNVGGMSIVCAAGMKDRSRLKQGADGTGMYTITDAVPNDHYTLTRRKDYTWGPGGWKPRSPGLPDRVVLKVVPNETTAANLLATGTVNAASITGPDQQRLRAMKLTERDAVAPLGEIWFNQKASRPGADETVRRALVQALDLQKLGKVFSSGNGRTSKGLIAPEIGPCADDPVSGSLPRDDLEASKAALDAAGWTSGPDGVRVRNGKKLSMQFLYPTSYGAPIQAGAELLQQMWKAAGVEVTIRGVSDTQSSQIVLGGQGTWDAVLLPFGITLPSQLVPFVTGPPPPEGGNFASIRNPEYRKHVAKAAARPGASGCTEWATAEKALYKHVDTVLFVDQVTPTFARNATFELSQGVVDPTTIRMLAG